MKRKIKQAFRRWMYRRRITNALPWWHGFLAWSKETDK